MTVLITLHDVERAVRLNAQLEREKLKTEMVSPLDDIRGVIRRVRPDVIVATGELTDRLTESIVQEQLWAGVPTIGLADTSDERVLERLRAVGYVELYVKPVDATELAAVV